MKDRLARYGLRLNLKKTHYLTINVIEPTTITVGGTDQSRTDAFEYLGSTIGSDGSLAHEITARLFAAWSKWRLMTGVLCERKMPDRLKSKIYRNVVGPVTLYGVECWPATKEVERRMGSMETKMLRWMGGVTRLDYVRKEDIRQRFGVVPIADKLREARLKWYVYVVCAESNTLRRIGLHLNVPIRRPIGRLKQRWWDTNQADLEALGVHPDHTHDRVKWRQLNSKAHPAITWEKR